MKRTPIAKFEFHYDQWFVFTTLFTMVPFLMLFAGIILTTTFLILFCTLQEEERIRVPERELIPLVQLKLNF